MSDRPPVPRVCALLGILLFGCLFVPLSPRDGSLAALLWLLIRYAWQVGAVVAAVVVPPFAFGLLVALHVLAPKRVCTRVLRWTNNVLIADLAFVAVILSFANKDFLAPWALLGVVGAALVGRLGMFLTSAPLTPRFLVRWGALLVCSVLTWTRLQLVGSEPTDYVIAIAAVLAAGLVFACRPDPTAQRGTPQ